MRDRFGLSRRQVLSGIATVGSIGAVSGAGAAGLFSDEELFTGNLLAVGELDLDLCWAQPGETCTPGTGPTSLDFGTLEQGDTGSASIQCSLEDNPGWTWLRTNCPHRRCGIQDKLRVSLWYDLNCDGQHDDDEPYVTVSLTEDQQTAIRDRVTTGVDLTGAIPIRDMELCDALTILRFGTLLDSSPGSEEVDPFDPDGWCCLGFEWAVEEYICVEDSFELNLEFVTQQWRHNPEPTTPWPDANPCEVDCRAECRDCSPKQGISFVAFGIENGTIEAGDVRLRPYYDIEGEVYKVDWQSAVDLDWVVLYYGSKDGKYFENFAVDGDTSGTVHVNTQTYASGDGDFHSKLSWDGGKDTTTLGQCPRDPCPDLAGEAYGCGVRYNFEAKDGREVGEWDSVCGNTCPGETKKGGGKP